MSLISFNYFLFLGLVALLHAVLPSRWKNALLLLASLFFYSLWDYRPLFLLGAGIVMHYVCAQKMSTPGKTGGKKHFLAAAVSTSLLVLGFFKYFDFFAVSLNRLLAAAGMNIALGTLNILLPVGLSFYTFIMIAYALDVYRGQVKAEADFVSFALFCSFFPIVLSGPIERAGHLLPQIKADRKVSAEDVKDGALLIIMGLFKKIVIADYIGHKVTEIFLSPGTHTAGVLLEGMYLFTLQIYCDFASYTDIARGSGRLLGFRIVRNFQQPYLSVSVSEFWRRWHISLSSFLRDYLYIPLGGNRQGAFLTYRNLMLTMLLGGLWHGANWTFIVWGGLHGLYLCIHRFCFREPAFVGRLRRRLPGQLWNAAGVAVTFHLVGFAWIFFKVDSMGLALAYIRGMLSPELFATFPLRVLAVFACVLALDLPFMRMSDDVEMRKWPLLLRGPVYAVILLLIANFSGGVGAPFVYFNF